MQEPKKEHMNVARWVLRYLKGTPGYGILMRYDCDLQVCPTVMQTRVPVH